METTLMMLNMAVLGLTDMQLQIECIEWDFEKIETNEIPIDRVDGLIRKVIKDLEIRKDKAMRRPDTDDLWTKLETIQWVLYVIFAIKNERIGCNLRWIIVNRQIC
jgi:hypothetical protein